MLVGVLLATAGNCVSAATMAHSDLLNLFLSSVSWVMFASLFSSLHRSPHDLSPQDLAKVLCCLCWRSTVSDAVPISNGSSCLLPFQSGCRAVPEPVRSGSLIVWQWGTDFEKIASFYTHSERFRGSSRAGSKLVTNCLAMGQWFWKNCVVLCGFRAVSGQFQSCFRSICWQWDIHFERTESLSAISGQFQCHFRAFYGQVRCSFQLFQISR